MAVLGTSTTAGDAFNFYGIFRLKRQANVRSRAPGFPFAGSFIRIVKSVRLAAPTGGKAKKKREELPSHTAAPGLRARRAIRPLISNTRFSIEKLAEKLADKRAMRPTAASQKRA